MVVNGREDGLPVALHALLDALAAETALDVLAALRDESPDDAAMRQRLDTLIKTRLEETHRRTLNHILEQRKKRTKKPAQWQRLLECFTQEEAIVNTQLNQLLYFKHLKKLAYRYLTPDAGAELFAAIADLNTPQTGYIAHIGRLTAPIRKQQDKQAFQRLYEIRRKLVADPAAQPRLVRALSTYFAEDKTTFIQKQREMRAHRAARSEPTKAKEKSVWALFAPEVKKDAELAAQLQERHDVLMNEMKASREQEARELEAIAADLQQRHDAMMAENRKARERADREQAELAQRLQREHERLREALAADKAQSSEAARRGVAQQQARYEKARKLAKRRQDELEAGYRREQQKRYAAFQQVKKRREAECEAVRQRAQTRHDALVEKRTQLRAEEDALIARYTAQGEARHQAFLDKLRQAREAKRTAFAAIEGGRASGVPQTAAIDALRSAPPETAPIDTPAGKAIGAWQALQHENRTQAARIADLEKELARSHEANRVLEEQLARWRDICESLARQLSAERAERIAEQARQIRRQEEEIRMLREAMAQFSARKHAKAGYSDAKRQRDRVLLAQLDALLATRQAELERLQNQPQLAYLPALEQAVLAQQAAPVSHSMRQQRQKDNLTQLFDQVEQRIRSGFGFMASLDLLVQMSQFDLPQEEFEGLIDGLLYRYRNETRTPKAGVEASLRSLPALRQRMIQPDNKQEEAMAAIIRDCLNAKIQSIVQAENPVRH